MQEESTEKKILFSAIQPSGNLTIGNYLGAIKNWIDLQSQYNCFYAVADLHSITVKQEPAELRKNTLDLIALYVACGVNPNDCTLFVQSQVPCHTELTWILNTMTYPGELSRMTQFKDKSAKHADNINMGLMDYPVLMASDILLYQTSVVPVGIDQKQHLELSRDLATRFNNRYSPTFVVPEPYIVKESAKIYDLTDPTRKMSKSEPNGAILLNDDRDSIIKKFKRAVTDSDSTIRYSEDKKGISNLLSIYSIFAEKSIAESEKEFEGKGYGNFKLAVGETVADKLKPIQEEKAKLLKDKAYLNEIIAKGGEVAYKTARKTLSKVYRKIGFYMGDR